MAVDSVRLVGSGHRRCGVWGGSSATPHDTLARVAAPPSSSTRLVAFYLPQFHPIPENDAWWGPGFTEWRFVARARPLFDGHEQPRQPADLGYYDLRSAEARGAQADLARAYGIDAFCYYHYWFAGRRLLARPLDEVLRQGEPDFPFCLCWANEPWSRSWLGEQQEVLVEQTYSAADDRAHAEHLAGVFSDPRYLRVAGRPVFLVYRPLSLPEPLRTTTAIKEAALARGLCEPYLVGANTGSFPSDFRGLGFDATLDWQPKLDRLGAAALDSRPRLGRGLRNLLRFRRWLPRLEAHELAAGRARMTPPATPPPLLPAALVGWDSTPRRGGRGIVLSGRSPARFERELDAALLRARDLPAPERLAFVFAWNEWCEGAYLEPDTTFGRGYLEAAARCVLRDRRDHQDGRDRQSPEPG